MPRYIPFPNFTDRMPIDISFVFEDEKPAGKHGFLKADGEDFRFEDGTLGRFWGVNFNGGACLPPHDYAEKVARRLAQSGCNLVRFHQLDSQWNTPNIFAYTKGKRLSTTRALDPKSLDALDYLVYCLKKEGIYCYLDMLTYRHFKKDDGVVDYELLSDKGNPWSMIDRTMIELQKEYCYQLWTHYNPYTELCYKDDPVFILTEIINETDLFTNVAGFKSDYKHSAYYEKMFREMFRDWLKENNEEYDWEHCNLYDSDERFIRFKIEKTKAYYSELYDYMRSIGVKIPITGTNWTHTSACGKAEEDMDFMDGHHYFYDWRWGNRERASWNRSINDSPYIAANLGKRAAVGKPFFVSEWDMPWPNSFRAEGPIYYATLGALQNWGGFAIHTYAYTSDLDPKQPLGREVSTPIAGVPYREGIFSAWNDPAKFGVFYHAALITRRLDVKPANKKVAALATDLGKTISTAFEGLMEVHQIKTCFDEKLPEGYDEIVNEGDKFNHVAKGILTSDNGESRRDLGNRVGYVDTERTKIAYGRLDSARPQASYQIPKKDYKLYLDGLTITPRTDVGVIAMSSLTDSPICESDNILLTTIGRARNTGAQFDGEKMIELGTAPIMVEVIDADIEMKTSRGDKLKVWGVNADGFYSAQIPTTYENGILSFRIGNDDNPSPYYLIVED